jgi:biopolymer transport protein ExbD
MKKIGILSGIVSLMMVTACNNSKNEPETQTDAPEVTKTTTTSTTKTNDNGTTIEVDEKGVSYGNRDGVNETTVKITTDSTKFKLKR